MFKVSVAMCTYNGSEYVEEQLKSIIDQSRCVDEIVIVDDCSTDNTVFICKNILKSVDGKIGYSIVQNEKNYGTLYSFNKCIGLCTGDLIFTSDQDDYWERNKVEIMIKPFLDKKCMLAFHDAKVVDKKLNVLNESAWDALCFSQCGLNGSKTQMQDYLKAVMYQTVVFGNMMVFRKELAEKCMPVPGDVQGWLHDNWIGICAPIYGAVTMVDDKLIKYRQHGNNSCGIKTDRNNKMEKNAYHIQRVLLYVRQNEVKLNGFLNTMRNDMSDEYISFIEYYINIYRRIETYIEMNNIQKITYLFHFILGKNRLIEFGIRRSNLIIYILYYAKKIFK